MVTIRTATAPVDAEQARLIGEDFIAEHLGDQMAAGPPWHVTSPTQAAWIVPLILTSPGFGPVGVVGAVVVDDAYGHITAWTESDRIEANARRLTEERPTELEQAFRQAILHVQKGP